MTLAIGEAVARASDQAFFFMPLMQFARKVLRGLPCRPFASACFEHSIDSGLRVVDVFAFGAAFDVAGGSVAGGGGVGVCANAAPAQNAIASVAMRSFRM